MKPLCHIFDVDVLSTFAQKCKNMLTEKTCGKYWIPNSYNMEILSLWRSYIFLRMPRITNGVTSNFRHDFSASSDLFHCTARDIGDTVVMWNEIGWWNRIFFVTRNFNSASLSQRKFADTVCRNHKYFFLLIIYSMLCRGPRDGSLKS